MTKSERETIGRKLIGAELLGKAEQLAHDLIETSSRKERAEILGRISAITEILQYEDCWNKLVLKGKKAQMNQLKEVAGI